MIFTGNKCVIYDNIPIFLAILFIEDYNHFDGIHIIFQNKAKKLSKYRPLQPNNFLTKNSRELLKKTTY